MPCFASIEMAAILVLWHSLNRCFKCSEKLHTHIQDNVIIDEERIYTSVFSFVD